jgi:hypothetical protein
VLAGAETTFWVHEPDRQEPLGSRWRVDIPAGHLPAGVVVYESQFDPAHQRGDTAIFVSPHFREAIRALKKAKKLGFRTAIEVDDGWIGMDPRFLALQVTEVGDQVAKVQEATQVYRQGQERHRWAASQVDAVIVSMPALAELYRSLNERVFVCPNSVDPDDWPAELRGLRPPGPFRVGFAGSTSHADDLPLVRDAFSWASSQPGVEVRFIGWHPKDPSPSWETASARAAFEESLRVFERDPYSEVACAEANGLIAAEKSKVAERQATWNFPLTVLPWTGNPEQYRSNLASLDVGLCPIDDEAPFSPGRSDLKVLEFAAAGVLPIVSDSPIYRDWRGFVPMARSSEEFVELVQWAVSHRDEVRAKAAAVWEHVERTRTIAKTIVRWREAVESAQAVAA